MGSAQPTNVAPPHPSMTRESRRPNFRDSLSGLSRPIGWLMGGLNHQIEHHLAPGVPHPAYPAMADRVRDVCAKRQLAYRVHPTFRAAVASHARWLRAMGRATATAGGSAD